MRDHPANAALRRYFEPRHHTRDAPPIAPPDQIARPYDSLGTHPDLVGRLWDQLGATLPVDCRAVFYGTPALRHPATGIVFGFAGGTHTYSLRLPDRERDEALRAGASRIHHYAGGQGSFDLDEIGPEWIFCKWLRGEEEWCRAAFDFAAGPA